MTRRLFRIHAGLFGSGVALLAVANWLTGAPWWSFWPILAWSLVFSAHYLVHKARTSGERWAEERAEDVRSKSYDRAHIDSIEKRYSDPEKK